MTHIDPLPYDQIAFKGSHNSIDRLRRHPWADRLEHQLSGTDGLSEPCRALELDLVQDEHRFRWRVQHGVNDEGPRLKEVLDVIRTWADRSSNAGHPVLTLHLDLKNDPLSHDGFTDAIDELLLDTLGASRIYRPGDVMGDCEDLVRGARAGGWATFGELRSRVIVCLSGRTERKICYARTSPRARLCFADYPGSRGTPRKGHRVFANLFVDAHGYRNNLRTVKAQTGFVARGYNIVHRRSWDDSVAGKANVLSGDVLDSPDLSFGGAGYAPATPND